MTAIAALVDTDRVWMAADSASYDNRNVLLHHPGKITTITFGDGERLLIATAGSAALGQLARHRLKIDAAPNPDDTADCNTWAFTLAEALAGLARDAHVISKEHDCMDGAALLAWRRHLWRITDHCASPVERFDTIGSGGELALGALDVLADGYEYTSFRQRWITGIDYDATKGWPTSQPPVIIDQPPTVYTGPDSAGIVTRAVQAACRWEGGCREPVHVACTGDPA